MSSLQLTDNSDQDNSNELDWGYGTDVEVEEDSVCEPSVKITCVRCHSCKQPTIRIKHWSTGSNTTRPEEPFYENTAICIKCLLNHVTTNCSFNQDELNEQLNNLSAEQKQVLTGDPQFHFCIGTLCSGTVWKRVN